MVLNSLEAAIECRPTEIRDDVMKEEIVVVGDYVMKPSGGNRLAYKM
jgi:hypothetical protein